MGDSADVSLAAAGLPNPAIAQADAPAQRHRGLADDAQDRLAEVLTTNTLTSSLRGLSAALSTPFSHSVDPAAEAMRLNADGFVP